MIRWVIAGLLLLSAMQGIQMDLLSAFPTDHVMDKLHDSVVAATQEGASRFKTDARRQASVRDMEQQWPAIEVAARSWVHIWAAPLWAVNATRCATAVIGAIGTLLVADWAPPVLLACAGLGIFADVAQIRSPMPRMALHISRIERLAEDDAIDPHEQAQQDANLEAFVPKWWFFLSCLWNGLLAGCALYLKKQRAVVARSQ